MNKAPRPYRLFIARGSSGMAELVPGSKEKRYKRKCYSTFEIKVLLKLVELHRDVIENKENNKETNALKNAAWEEVHAAFSATPGTEECSPGQLRQLWKNLKRKRERQENERLLKNAQFLKKAQMLENGQLLENTQLLENAQLVELIGPDSDAGSSIETASVSEDASQETPPIKIEIVEECEKEVQETAGVAPTILPSSSNTTAPLLQGLKLKNPRSLPRFTYLQRHRQPMLRAEARVARVEEELLAVRERMAQDELRELSRQRASTEARLTEQKLRLEIQLLEERLERERKAAEERMRMDKEEHELRMRLMYGKLLDKK